MPFIEFESKDYLILVTAAVASCNAKNNSARKVSTLFEEFQRKCTHHTLSEYSKCRDNIMFLDNYVRKECLYVIARNGQQKRSICET
eukprot:SAG31_NODE_450_length_15512_cov_5.788555_5_plen_87_part_00